MSSKKNLPSRFDIDMTPLHDFMKQMDSFFNNSFKQMNNFFQFKPFWVDVKETKSHFIIEAELVDSQEDQIKIQVSGNQVRIGVQDHQMINQKDMKNGYSQNKQSLSIKERIISLPFEIPKKEVKATFERNLLKITIPKPKNDYININTEDT